MSVNNNIPLILDNLLAENVVSLVKDDDEIVAITDIGTIYSSKKVQKDTLEQILEENESEVEEDMEFSLVGHYPLTVVIRRV